MFYVYLLCAIVGGTIMVCQFILTLLGMGHEGDAAFDGHGAGFDHPGAGQGHGPHQTDSTWLFGVITFRTVVAALAFFGLAGLAGNAGNLSVGYTLGIAAVAGLAAMYGVHSLMQVVRRLREEGTARIQLAVGCTGNVYLRIPGQKAGTGKVTVEINGREVEYEAMTTGPEIATGARVHVVGVLGPDTLEVAEASQVQASA